MEYVPLGKTGLITSVIGLGGGSSGRFGLAKGGTRADAVPVDPLGARPRHYLLRRRRHLRWSRRAPRRGTRQSARRCRAFDQGPSRPRSVPFFGNAAREPGVVLGCSAGRISLHCANHSEAGRADAEGASNGQDRPPSPARRHAAPASARGCADPSRAGEDEGGGKNSCDRNYRGVPHRSRPRHAAPGGQGRSVRRDHDGVQPRQPERGGCRHSNGDELRQGRDRNVRVARIARTADELRRIADDAGASSLSDLAYRYARHQAGMDVVLTGTGDPDHLRQNIAAVLSPPLPDPVLDRLRRFTPA